MTRSGSVDKALCFIEQLQTSEYAAGHRPAVRGVVRKRGATDNFGMVRQEKADCLKGASPFRTDMHDNTKT